MNSDSALIACNFSERLHPVSQIFLDQYLDSVLTEQLFLRYFSLPNSSYIALAECLVALLK